MIKLIYCCYSYFIKGPNSRIYQLQLLDVTKLCMEAYASELIIREGKLESY
jgi:hypothetical protein